MQQNFMPWVDLLPEVGDPIRNERNKLTATLTEAEELERQAAARRAAVREGRAALLDRIMKQWTLHDIEQAATAAGDRGQPFPPGFVKDGELREALRALDGAPSALEVLQAFHAGRVIRQHNLFSTATEEEHLATLHRVFGWWNYGAVPLGRLGEGGPMRIDDEAAALVAAVDPAAVAAVIAEFPEAEKVGIRANWQDIDPHLGQRVPKAPADRAEYLARKIEQYEAELQRDIATYTRYREQGLAALSAYDVCISSGNNPLGALRTALRLKHAHISYDLSILVKLSLALEDVKTELAEAEPPQLALF